MDYNKHEEVDRYFTLEDIFKLNIPNKVKSEIKNKFNKKVFYDNNDSCQVGTLIGLEMNYVLSKIRYIIDVNGEPKYIPIWKSITKL